ncbi:MAG: hypothetical protein IBJ10_06390 [Phycisphaerales bacterium]|nr:hypothetical protein [Phycisphaerales bacterium]
MRTRSARGPALAGAAALTLACSCGSPPVEESGIRIGDETLRQFRADVTTEAWLVAVLGPPTSWVWVEGVENTKVLRYASGEQSRGLLTVFTGAGSRTTAVTYFIVSDGVVTRFWADRSRERNLMGNPVEEEPGEKAGDS